MPPPTTPPATLVECDLILPCKDEAPALRLLLPKIPPEFAVIVVDNNSSDGTAEVAKSLGVAVTTETRAGYGAAVQAGLDAATREFFAIMDGDGSFDPAELLPLLDDVRAGRADMAVGRRRPVRRGVWPWHARLGNRVILAWLRRRIGMNLHDIAPMRVCRRRDLVELGIQDRRFGYPVELMQKATQARWRLIEHDIVYYPRAEGTKSKVSGSVKGTIRAARDFWRVLEK